MDEPVEIKNDSIKEIVEKCRELNWDIENVTIITRISTTANSSRGFVKVYITNNK